MVIDAAVGGNRGSVCGVVCCGVVWLQPESVADLYFHKYHKIIPQRLCGLWRHIASLLKSALYCSLVVPRKLQKHQRVNKILFILRSPAFVKFSAFCGKAVTLRVFQAVTHGLLQNWTIAVVAVYTVGVVGGKRVCKAAKSNRRRGSTKTKKQRHRRCSEDYFDGAARHGATLVVLVSHSSSAM